MEKEKPLFKMSCGSIKATVWNNGEENKTYQTITFERVYKDKEYKWQSTNVFRVNDLPKLEVLRRKIYDKLMFS